METSPWWFTSVMTFAGAVLGGGVSILTTFLTQRYALKAQLAIKKADAETGVAAALRSEKEKRYLAITQNLDSFYTGTQDPTRKVEFLKTQRELWLLGDQELIRNFEPSWEISPRAERSLLMSASLGT